MTRWALFWTLYIDLAHTLPTDLDRSSCNLLEGSTEMSFGEQQKNHQICKDVNIRFVEDLIKEDCEARKAVWPQVEQARREGLKTMFHGPYTYISGQRVTP